MLSHKTLKSPSRSLSRQSSGRSNRRPQELVTKLEERRLMVAPDAVAGFAWDTAAANVASIKLDWTDGTSETGFRVDRFTGTAWVQQGANLAADLETVTVASLTGGTEYLFRIRAFNANGFSPVSTVVRANTLTAAPVVTAGVSTASTVVLAWPAIVGEDGVVIESSDDAGTTWAEAGTVGADVITFTAVGLTAGTSHQFRARGVNEAGASANSAVVTRATNLARLSTPTSASVTSTGASINWTNVVGETGYKVERLTGTAWAQVGSNVAADVATLAITGLTAGTTTSFRVRAINASGDSAPSDQVDVTTLPPQVTGLTATAVSSTRISLAWTNIVGETGYTIERSADAGTTWAEVGNTAADAVAFVGSGLTAGTSYQWRVTSFNDGGNGAVSAVVTRGTLLAAPAGFEATTIAGTTVTFGWTDGSGETGYVLERLTGVVWTAVGAVIAADAVTGVATTLTAGTDYSFRLRAANAAGNGAPTGALRVTTLPAAPTLTATTFSSRQINLAWTNVTGESRFVLERSTDGTTWTAFNVSADALTYSARSLSPNTSYQFRVRGVNSGGAGANSAVATRSTLLSAPRGLTGVGALNGTTVTLNWTDGAGETGYKIERLNGAVWTLVGAATAADAITLSATGLTSGTSNQFRLRAVSAAGDSAPSPSVTVFTRPAAPTLTTTPVSSTSVALAWTNVVGETGYAIERSIDAGTTWVGAGSRSADQLTFTSSGLLPNTAYQFRIRARNESGLGTPSAVVNRTTTLGFVPNVSAEGTGPTTVAVTWGAITGETGFLVQRRQAGAWVTVSGANPLAADTIGFSVTGLTANTAYTFRVVAVSAAGNGDGSDDADATTID